MSTAITAGVQALETLTGACVSYHDFTGTLIPLLGRQRRRHIHPFCRAVKRTHEGRCMNTDGDLVRAIIAGSNCGFWKSCHAGVYEYVLPVASYGVLFFGPFSGGKKPRCELSQRAVPLGKLPRPAPLTDALSLSVLLSSLAREMLREIEGRTPIADRRRDIERFFSERSCDAVRCDDLADRIGVSVSRTRQLIRSWYGTSFSKVLTENRMRRACQLLASSDAAPRVIARRIGFIDSDYFFKVFRKFTGMTPLTYRKKQTIHV